MNSHLPCDATPRCIFLQAVSIDSPQDVVIARDLGTKLESCFFRETALEGVLQRELVASDRDPLGLDWRGIFRLTITAAAQVRLIWLAIRSAFGGRNVFLRVTTKKGEFVLKVENLSEDELRRLLAIDNTTVTPTPSPMTGEPTAIPDPTHTTTIRQAEPSKPD